PNEAEWEYACRAGTQTAYHFGDDPKDLPKYAWFFGNAQGGSHSVGTMKPNAWGLYDMHGNVWQWCNDWYGPYGDVGKNESRVLRGGSWGSLPARCRAALRFSNAPSGRNSDTGFRVTCCLH